jgi:HEAT repeat protein
MRDDPDPEVRAAAVAALVSRRGVDAFPAVAPLLAEFETPPGAAAVRALGALGEPVVPLLVAWLEGRPAKEARGAVVALARAGPAGTIALRGIAQTHPDESVRGLAGFLLGRRPAGH